MAKTYGEKPIIFAFEENGEQYMIGSEVTVTVEYFCQVRHLNIFLINRLATTSVCSGELSTKSIRAWQEEI